MYCTLESKTKYFRVLLDMLHWFASPQIKNVAVSEHHMIITYTVDWETFVLK